MSNLSAPADLFRTFPDLDGLPRQSRGVFLTVAYGNFSRSSLTLKRWVAYSQLHRLDMAVLQTPPAGKSSYCAAHRMSCAVWDKLHATEQLFRKGYELVLYADGDAVVIDWRRSPWDVLAGAQKAARQLPCFVVSADRGHYGSFGDANLGVMLLRNCNTTRTALEWVVAREKGHEKWPAEQHQLNKYLRTREGTTWASRVPYCTLQCTVDNGFWSMRGAYAAFLKRRKDANSTAMSTTALLYDDWRYEVQLRVKRLVDQKVWAMHTIGAKHIYFKQGSGLPPKIEEMVHEAFLALDRVAPLPPT